MMGPKTDVAFITEYQKMGGKDRRGNPRFIDERAFKRRTGGFISLGGAITPHWLSFGLPLLYTMTFPLQIDIVDQMQVTRIGKFGHAVMQNEVMARARKLGRNVAKVMKNPTTEKKWFGDESGVCPVCHSNLLMIKNENPVVCPICGISGKLRVECDNIIVTFSQKEQTRSRLTIAGKYEHWLELSGYGNLKQQVDTGEIARRLDEFQGYKEVKKCNKNV